MSAKINYFVKFGVVLQITFLPNEITFSDVFEKGVIWQFT